MRVLRFIGLKVMEITAIVLYAHGSYLLVSYIHSVDIGLIKDWYNISVIEQHIMSSLVMFAVLLMSSIIIFLIIQLIKLNWKWSK